MLRSIIDKLQVLFAHSFFPIVLLSIVIPLALPLIYTGWFTDDILHRAAYVDSPNSLRFQPTGAPLKGPMEMYSFFDGDMERFQRVLDYGHFPWWSSPHIRAALWRPITALLSMLDFWLWPHSPELMHVQSMCWFALLIILSGLVYQKILGATWAAGLASLLYVICDIQAIPIAFLANRHILIAAVFGIGSIGAYFRWREQNQTGWAYASALLFALSLLASESGIAVFGYFLSHSLWIERGKILARLKPLIPFILITIIWRITYKALGYGISGVEFYVDPGSDPLRFTFAFIEKFPMILLHTVAFPPADIAPIVIVTKLYWVLVIFILGLLGCLFFPFYRNCKISLFFLCGSFFSAIPLCAAMPGGRSLALASFGMTGFLAQIIFHAFKGKNTKSNIISWRSLSIMLLSGLVILRLILGVYNLNQGHRFLQTAQKGLNRLTNLQVDDPALNNQDVIFVNHPFTIFTVYIAPSRLLENKPLPAHIRTLGSGLESIEIKRSGQNTIIVRPKDGYMCPPKWDQISLKNLWSYPTLIQSIRYVERLFFNRNDPFKLGQTISLTGVKIQITDLTEDSRPAEATFTFDLSLDDSSLRWLQWNKKDWRYEAFVVPRIGESIVLQ